MITFKINPAGLVEPHGPSANKINGTTGALGWSQLEGTRRIYQLNPVQLAALRDQLDTYWRRALTNYAEVLSDDTHRPREGDDRAQHRKDNP